MLGTAVIMVLTGLCVGILSGLLGIGGGMLMVPILRLIFGLDAHMATATSLFTIIPTSASGMSAHVRGRTCIPRLGLMMGLGGAVTSTLGVWLASRSPAIFIMAVTAAIIVYSSYNMLSKVIKGPKTKGGPVVVPNPDDYELTPKRRIGAFLVGMCAGLGSGYCGVGGGFIMMPLMTSLLGVPMKLASGTSLIGIIILATPGVIEQMLLGNVNYLAGIMLAVGSIPGAVLGAKFNARVPERTLRLMLAGLLFIAAIMLVAKELGLF